MIKFFRHIRKSLLMENKTSKYFKYALGEIVLVVIGILLALQINNWNEEKKKQQVLISILINIKTDLQEDIQSINLVFDKMLPRKPYFERVMYKTITLEEYKTCEPCKELIFSYPDINLETRGLNKLKDFNANLTEESQKLDTDINHFYNEMRLEIAIDEKAIMSDFTRNYDYWIENTDWYSDNHLGLSNDGFIEYALNSSHYRNSVTIFYHIYYDIYFSNLETYIEGANVIISNIDQFVVKHD